MEQIVLLIKIVILAHVFIINVDNVEYFQVKAQIKQHLPILQLQICVIIHLAIMIKIVRLLLVQIIYAYLALLCKILDVMETYVQVI